MLAIETDADTVVSGTLQRFPTHIQPLFCRPQSEFRAQKSNFCCFAGKIKKAWWL
jgi:hypothetical protein